MEALRASVAASQGEPAKPAARRKRTAAGSLDDAWRVSAR